MVVQSGTQKTAIPIEDIGMLILNSPQSTYSHASLTQCVEHNVALIVCDNKHLPCGMFLPFNAHSLQSKYMALQIQVPTPTKKRIWQSIVRAKIRAQSQVLQQCGASAARLATMAGKVRSGDPDNYEAQAARYYWPALFGPDFRRTRYGTGVNPLLNYGYAIVRAAVARAIAGAGLHPSFGIHHHNQNNAFCLADDLIEPIRPLVDKKVYELWQQDSTVTEVSTAIKVTLLELLKQSVHLNTGATPLMSALQHYASSFRKVLAKETARLNIPRI